MFLDLDVETDKARFQAAATLSPADALRALGNPPILVSDEAQRMPEVSVNELATQLQIARPTVDRYLDLLEQTFVIFRLPSFSTIPRKGIAKSQKVFFGDTGIRNALLNALATDEFRPDIGALCAAPPVLPIGCRARRAVINFAAVGFPTRLGTGQEEFTGLAGRQAGHELCRPPTLSWPVGALRSRHYSSPPALSCSMNALFFAWAALISAKRRSKSGTACRRAAISRRSSSIWTASA